MNEFFTSDNHFFHKNVLSFEDRPYSSVEEMNAGMIESWNSVVKENDIVYHLGDMVFGNIDKWKEVLLQLNGKIRLIRGNHDTSNVVTKLSNEGYFDEYHDVCCYIKRSKFQMWLTHYPMNIGMRSRKFSISGHIHSTPSVEVNQINVGVDSPLFKRKGKDFGKPVSLEELIWHMECSNLHVEHLFREERGLQ